jgi:hypothetical protein
MICINCGVVINYPRRGKKFCSNNCKYLYRVKFGLYKGNKNPFYGKKMSPETKEKLRVANTGKHLSEDTKLKLRQVQRDSKSPFWKGGVSLIWWRKRVLEKFNNTCVDCGLNEIGIVDAHHIKSQRLYPELKTDINNGIALCCNCHRRRTINDNELNIFIKKNHWHRKNK